MSAVALAWTILVGAVVGAVGIMLAFAALPRRERPFDANDLDDDPNYRAQDEAARRSASGCWDEDQRLDDNRRGNAKEMNR